MALWMALRSGYRPHLLLLAACCLLVFLLRAQSFPHYVDNFDESIFWTMAQDIVNGGIPYVTTWDHKGPVLFYLLAVPTWFYPASIEAQEAFAALCVLSNMVFMYLIAQVYTSRLFAIAGAFSYGLLVSLWWPGLTGNAEHYVTFLQLPAIYALVLWREKKQDPKYLMIAGALAAAIVLSKFNLILVMAPAVLLLSTRNAGEFVENVLWVALGALIPTAILCLYFLYLGNLDEFFISYVLFNQDYTNMFPSELAKRTYQLFSEGPQGAMSILGFSAMLYLVMKRKSMMPERRRFLDTTLIGITATAVAISAPGQGLAYYYLSIIPVFCLLVPLVLEMLTPVPESEHPRVMNFLFLSLLAASVVMVPFTEAAYGAAHRRIERSPRMQAARYIAEHTQPGDKIFAIYGDALIYFLANRVAPSRTFLWMHNTVDYRNRIIQTLNIENPVASLYADPPVYIFFCQECNSHKFGPVPKAYRRFINEYYELETTFKDIAIYRYRKGMQKPAEAVRQMQESSAARPGRKGKAANKAIPARKD